MDQRMRQSRRAPSTLRPAMIPVLAAVRPTIGPCVASGVMDAVGKAEVFGMAVVVKITVGETLKAESVAICAVVAITGVAVAGDASDVVGSVALVPASAVVTGFTTTVLETLPKDRFADGCCPFSSVRGTGHELRR